MDAPQCSVIIMVSIFTRATHSICFINLRGSYGITMQVAAAVIDERLIDEIRVVGKPHSQNTSSVCFKLLCFRINADHPPRGAGPATSILGSSSSIRETIGRKTVRRTKIVITAFPSIDGSITITVKHFHTAIITYTAENVKSFDSVQTPLAGGASTASREGIMLPLR